MAQGHTPLYSSVFERLYNQPELFERFSGFQPVSLKRALPFQHAEEGLDDPTLLRAEEAHLANQSDQTRRTVVDEYLRCGLLEEADAAALRPVVDFYGGDFFELMGVLYANAGRFRCALRWYREWLRELETRRPEMCSDTESVYAGVGYCLYSLGLFEEAISWSKSCIGPRLIADTVTRALIDYEAELDGGMIQTIQRSGPRTKYLVCAFDPAHSSQAGARLKAAAKAIAPWHEVYLEWVSREMPGPALQAFGYPFKPEFDCGTLVRHKMNLIFATCARADALTAAGYHGEAKRLLAEAALVEPAAGIVAEKLKSLP